jgi:hypothetical protein
VADPIATHIAKRLLTVPGITDITGDRILDFDYRAEGVTPLDVNGDPIEIFDDDEIILPTIVVDDAGGMRPFAGPGEGEENRIFVWAFSAKGRLGHIQVKDMLLRAKHHLMTVPDERRISIHWVDSVGVVFAPDGVYDRHTFKVAGIPAPPE